MLANRLAPLHSLDGPFPRYLQRLFRNSGCDRRQGQPSGVECGQRDLQTVAFPADQVVFGHPDAMKPGHAVFDATQSHELVAPLHGDPGRISLDDKGADSPSVPFTARYPRHNH